jgi:mannose-1-phosphate guanylyltransferase
MRHAMIMAGGAGTRLWPMSRRDEPKQLLKFIQDKKSGAQVSLLSLAAHRLEGLVPVERRLICTSEGYRGVIRRDLPEFTDERILGEPVGRDTVNAVAFGAAVLAKKDPNAIFAVLTSDHIIEPDEVFKARMDLAFRLVEQDARRFVTFAIKPTYPATGFGYVQRGAPIREIEDSTGKDGHPLAYRVERFVEKPDLARAQAYVQSGEFGWNSGMFVWKAQAVLDCLKKYKPESHAGVMEIAAAWGTAEQKAVIDRVYPTLPKISVDYGMMEPVAAAIKQGDRTFSIATVEMDVRWLDVGSWPSYAQTVDADASGNRVAGSGKGMVVNGRNNLVVAASSGKLVALLGCDDMVVVDTPEATLVMPRSKAEDLKLLHSQVEDRLK